MTDLHPTSAEPEVCHVCGRRAAGLGFSARRPDDNRWLCQECVPLVEYVKDIRRWDPYEVKAIDAVDEATGEFAADNGTDIASYDDDTRRELWRVVLRSHQAEVRRLVRDGEAPW